MNNEISKRLIYENPLSCERDVTDFCSEGYVTPSFPNGRMRLESGVDLLGGHKYNFLFWCPETFPSDIMLEWDFIPIKEPGLCMVFFAATGRNGEDIFDDSLKKRTGDYPEYHHGDINAFHLSYFRRNKHPRESGFHTCNLRKSYGFHLLAMGTDPIPNAEDAVSPYNITVVKHSNKIAMFFILKILS